MGKTDDFLVIQCIFELCLKPRFKEISHISCKRGYFYLSDCL